MNQQLFYLSDENYNPSAQPEIVAIVPATQATAIATELNRYTKYGSAWTVGAQTAEAIWTVGWLAKPLRQVVEDLAYDTLSHQPLSTGAESVTLFVL